MRPPDSRRELPANLAPDAFAGTAAAYARYREPYPRTLLDDLIERAGVPDGAALLDLATGPGRLALDLAKSFRTVVAVDLEPEMIALGRELAERRGIDNVSWRVGRAEAVDAEPATFDLITIGEAFHRLDRPVIASKALIWLKPGGCLATLGPDGTFAGADAWQLTVTAVRERWIAKAFPRGGGGAALGGFEAPDSRQELLRDAGFVDVEERTFPVTRIWTLDEIVGYLRSTSVCSQKALGADFEAFEADLRAALLRHAPSLTFAQTIRWGYTLARKPARAAG